MFLICRLAIATTPFKEILHEILYQIHEISQAREDYCGLGIETKVSGVRCQAQGSRRLIAHRKRQRAESWRLEERYA
jgi:hypothetical protein